MAPENTDMVTKIFLWLPDYQKFPRFTSAAVSHEWLLFSLIIVLITVSQIEFDPEM
jgi:hypothetical protein